MAEPLSTVLVPLNTHIVFKESRLSVGALEPEDSGTFPSYADALQG